MNKMRRIVWSARGAWRVWITFPQSWRQYQVYFWTFYFLYPDMTGRA